MWTVNALLDPVAPEPVITGVLDFDRTWFGDPAADWTIHMATAKEDERTAFWEPYGALDRSPTAVWRAREHVDYRAMLVRDHIGALTAMYDRNILGTRLMPQMRKRQDYALWLSIMRDGADARGLAEPLAVYRAHQAGSLSSNKLSLVQYNWALYREHEHLSVPRATRALAGAVRQSLRNSRI
ncbi:hypothetical protein SAMN05216268_109244 [Streptomyces yunnanensis]|uniref:Uncharacterized protein n=1 Tax=Streptomyces yunnanensis TaxID=156453 RepID=A0A9X8MXY4_9ACTN|nr:hypothetical protein SAMN05216268_109244 [Streptomyces yunnanensis]